MHLMRCDRCGEETTAVFSVHRPLKEGRVFPADWITLTDAGGWEQYDLCPECVPKWHAVRSPVMKKFIADGRED